MGVAVCGGASFWRQARLVVGILLLAALSACASHRASTGYGVRGPSRYYPPPGPPDDPWGPYIKEASRRFSVPEQWIRAVMRQESAGREDAVSSAGAMGLMQVIPSTYAELRARYDLGDDPFDPHNNILAGTAYIREMYDRFGAPGFLAAYNAGPDRLDSYLAGTNSLPNETVNYLASIAPRLGGGTVMRGPLAVYAGNAGTAEPSFQPEPAPFAVAALPTAVPGSSGPGCDPDAAYDPTRPCARLAEPPPAEIAAASPPEPAEPAAAPAYQSAPEPASPEPAPPPAAFAQAATPAPVPPQPVGTQSAIYMPAVASAPPSYAPPSYVPPSYVPPSYVPPPPYAPPPPRSYAPQPQPQPRLWAASAGEASGGAWAIQVGAFANPAVARAAASAARGAAPGALTNAGIELPTTAPFGGKVLYRARLTRLSAGAATQACAQLSQRQLPCMVVPPGQGS